MKFRAQEGTAKGNTTQGQSLYYQLGITMLRENIFTTPAKHNVLCS